MRLAIVETATGKVVNVIEAPEDWPVDEGYEAIPSVEAGPDDLWDGSAFTKPRTPIPPPTDGELYAVATTDTERLKVIAGHLGLTEQ